LASICPQETTALVLFRQKVPHTASGAASGLTQESQLAVTAALEWLQKVQLAGIRVEKVPAPPEDFLRHTADFDIVVREDPSAPAIWARHYEIGTNRPIFAGRDGIRKYSLSEIARERRTGTRWYGDWPADLLARNAGQKSSN
ncbi:MAG: pectate lyase, partial [Phycisphaerae bacterium]